MAGGAHWRDMPITSRAPRFNRDGQRVRESDPAAARPPSDEGRRQGRVRREIEEWWARKRDMIDADLGW